jgi:hypothetical protein
MSARGGLISQLGAPEEAAIEIHYLIGDTTEGEIHRSDYLPAQVSSLHSAVRWRFQTLSNWFGTTTKSACPRSRLLALGKWP